MDIMKVWKREAIPEDLDARDLGVPNWTREPVIKILVDEKEITLSAEIVENIRADIRADIRRQLDK